MRAGETGSTAVRGRRGSARLGDLASRLTSFEKTARAASFRETPAVCGQLCGGSRPDRDRHAPSANRYVAKKIREPSDRLQVLTSCVTHLSLCTPRLRLVSHTWRQSSAPRFAAPRAAPPLSAPQTHLPTTTTATTATTATLARFSSTPQTSYAKGKSEQPGGPTFHYQDLFGRARQTLLATSFNAL
jgi:hypothetical protein